MPLVHETKMADARKYSVSGNHWPGEPRGQCLKLRPHLNFVPRFLEPTTWQVFSINTSSSNSLPLFHISLTGPTHSLQCDFLREYYHSFQLTAVNRHKMYMSRNHCLNSYTFSVRFFSTSKTEILSNHRKKQQKYVVNMHWTLLLFSPFCSFSCVSYTHRIISRTVIEP